MQSRTDSLMEAIANIVVGFSINFVANILILPAVFHVPVNLGELGFIGALYTVISLVRSYTLRRAFNGKTIWQAIKDRFGLPQVRITLAPGQTAEFHGSAERAQQARQRVEQLIGRP